MRCGSFLVVLISAFAWTAIAEDTAESDQCSGPLPFDRRPSNQPRQFCKKPVFKPDVQGCLKKTREMLVKRYHEAREEKKGDQTDTQVGGDDGCMANCFTSTDIFQNDEINRDELIKALETQSEDRAWDSIHSDAVDKCI